MRVSKYFWIILLIAGLSILGYIGNLLVVFLSPFDVWFAIIIVAFPLTILVHIILKKQHDKELKMIIGR